MVSQPLFTDHDVVHLGVLNVPHVHKVLGFLCLGHYALRFWWLVRYGSMYFDPSSWVTWATPAVHLLLSCSSFIFPVPQRRFDSKPIIWKELQLHNILFTFRSCIIFWLWCLTPCFSGDCGQRHWFLRLLMVCFSHYVADRITEKFEQSSKTTTRDMPWGPNVPKWVQQYVKVYYAVCQLFATTALLICGSLVLDSAFAIMFPIQLSTFLMTLVRKNLISGTSWHVWYALSLGAVFAIPISHSLRISLKLPPPSFLSALTRTHETPLVCEVIKLLIAPLAVFLRLKLRLDKYLVFAIVTVSFVSLTLFEREVSSQKAVYETSLPENVVPWIRNAVGGSLAFMSR
uniref:Uncharacterized protein n=1 Tax=Hanusia phi TaxID=3032 RepID=A0A7S0HUI4_9CRYP|mmetsp:Transcript_34471/g.77733  ORF Transcript_34471/g.77733 Transcript_34471/m.77733 type:complete len:344 (+) Transcript_34471:117-1148(+)